MPRRRSWRPNVLLAMNNAARRAKVLAAAAGTPPRTVPATRLAQGEVSLALGQTAAAERTFKRLLLAHPLSPEAEIARAN